MKKIWKFPLSGDGLVSIPSGAQFLDVQYQDGVLCLWAEVDERAPLKNHYVWVMGTGWTVPARADYIGTVQTAAFAWHVYVGEVA